MRLKKLILHGFKSFADRTEFVFDSPVVGIVGPNGCGKSNVVDGFKWVLGEQSAKSLRGDAMLDVIFNGSGNRKPAGMAEVTLVFENPQGPDGLRALNLDTDDVAVGRRLYRDGTSEYQINNHTSRLKDIRELFLDTGVGVDAYSVIEQGRVAALLEANPEERRLIFEEAAGISKFKAKKKESLRKLEKVDQNLLRVTDIVDEVEKRLRGVKIQAGRARTFQEYSTRLNELRLTYSLQEYHTLFTKLTELEARRDDTQFRLEDVTVDLQRKQNELGDKREQLESLSQNRQATEYELVQARASVETAKQRQQYAGKQMQQVAEQIEAFDADRARDETRLTEVRGALVTDRNNLTDLTNELERASHTIEEKQQAFRDGQLRLNQQSAAIEKNKSLILEMMRKLAQIGNRISAIEIERKNIAAQQSRLADRRGIVRGEIEEIEAKKSRLQAQLDETLATIQTQGAAMETKRADAASLGKQIAGLTEQLGAAKEHRSGLLSRQNVLKDLEARREGVSEGVKAVLRKRADKYTFIRGLVADALRVDVEHARVVEAALDGRDQWLIAPSTAAAMEKQELLAELEGRVNILFLDELASLSTGTAHPATIPSETGNLSSSADHGGAGHATVISGDFYDWNQHSQLVRLAIDLVRVEPENEPLARRILGKTVIVDTLDDARNLHRDGPEGWRFVTRNGEVIEADGTLRAGPHTAAMGILSRRSELEAIVNQIADVDGRIEKLSVEVSAGNEQAKAIENDVNAIRAAAYQSNTQKVELASAIATSDDKLNTLKRELPVLDRELQNLLEQTSRIADEEVRLTRDREAMEANQAARQTEVESVSAKQIELADQIKLWGEQLTSARVSLGQIQEKQLSCRQQVQRHAAAESELVLQIERLVKSAEAASRKEESLNTELNEAVLAEQALERRQQNLTDALQTLTGRVTQMQGVMQLLSRDVDGIRERHADIEQSLHELQVQTGEANVRLEMLVSGAMNDLQLDLPARYSEGYQSADMDWSAVAEEIKQLKEKIHRLGNVNLDALGELDELEQRQQFLAAQMNDLAESKKQLEELIDTINQESSVRFEQTFNAVREHFQGMFRKLFGGGKADVFLETEVEDKSTDQQPLIGPDGQTVLPIMRKKIDPLDAGIEIIARPPGKQPATISQLSGGEKAMTCIALLMSIFKSKPSPFCILDEVDAPLDEANNQRFGLIIQEFLSISQFIVITHHKRTMQICDVLYGVTMQEQGVSKRVAVKFDQVDHQGQISETEDAEEIAAA